MTRREKKGKEKEVKNDTDDKETEFATGEPTDDDKMNLQQTRARCRPTGRDK